MPQKTLPPSIDSRIPVTVIFFALMAITFIAYVPALHGDFLWDDDDYVTQNQTLRDVGGLGRIWFEIGATRQYYPLVYSTFWLEYHLWGANPVGYHIVNVLLHGLGAALLMLVLRRLTVPGALLAAAIFALHPINVESVAWITERKNVLCGVFYIASALAYLRFTAIGAFPLPVAKLASAPKNYLFALFLFTCAMLSKTIACSLPAAILLILWWKRGRITRRDILQLLPMFALGIALGIVTAWMENTHVGAGGPEWHRPFSVRLFTAGRAFWFYLGKLIWPASFTFVYPKWNFAAANPGSYAFPLAALLLLIITWAARSRLGRGPVVAILFFAGALFPALGFFNVYYAIRFSPVADHFVYIAAVGPLALVAAAITHFLSRKNRGPLLILAGIPLVALLGLLTWRQCAVYENIQTLWQDTLSKNPNAAIAHQGLGAIFQKQNRFTEAEASYRRSLELDPLESKTHFNLAITLQLTNRLDEAIAEYTTALRLNPDYPKCLASLGNALIVKGRPQEALVHLQKAVMLQPEYAFAHANLAAALENLNRLPEALAEYREAVRQNPKDEKSDAAARAIESRVPAVHP